VPTRQIDKYYVERCLDGHPDDFRYLVRRYQVVLLGYLVGRLGSRDMAEEAAQESLVRAYVGLRKLRKTDSFFAWLLGIASRVAREMQRSGRNHPRVTEALSERTVASEPACDVGVEQAVAALPPPYRQVILLRYYGGCSCGEISEQLDVPLGTVTKQLSRAYAMLRRSLTQRSQEKQVQK
jgi:RNA polymerase sigma-70 factor (ECF subfamily)